MLRADNVSFGYGAAKPAPYKGDKILVTGLAVQSPYVLTDVTADFPRGTITGILGPNGSGKTTLLRLLSGSRRPLSGQILLDDRPIGSYTRREVARRIAVVPQETQLAFEYTVLEMVLMGRHPHLALFEVEGPHDLAVARDALAATGTDHLDDRRFSTLSGGEKQRVVIAAALAQASDILLLDEPTASLDLGYQLEIASLLTTLNRERGLTIVISTHDLNLAAAVCSEQVLLRDGTVLAHGRSEDVLTSERVRDLYDVDADVQRHDRTGQLVVVPITRVTHASSARAPH